MNGSKQPSRNELWHISIIYFNLCDTICRRFHLLNKDLFIEIVNLTKFYEVDTSLRPQIDKI